MSTSDVLPAPAAGPAALPRLASGTELLGQYQDSAYQDPRFLIRRSDGQVMQLPRLLYRVAASLDGRDAEEVATELGAEFGRELTAEQVVYLVEDRLRPVGLLAPESTDPGGGDSGVDIAAPPVRSDPLLALRYRAALVPASVAWRIAGLFRPLFRRPVWVTLLAAFVAVDIWIIAQGDVLARFVAAVEEVVRRPGLILVILGLTLASAAFHEAGHVTACRYGGARPGALGVGLYVVWPAFYSTVTDSYRLDRVGRVRTDLGGVYFNAVFLIGAGLTYAATGAGWLLIALVGMHVQTAVQFLPSLRLDGYYILADLVGVPDLFGLVGPVLSGLLPGRPAHPLVRQLKPHARRLVVLWVVLVIPTLTFWLVTVLLAAPTVLPAAYAATLDYLQALDAAARAGEVVATTLGVLQLLLLALPWVGLALVLWPLVRLLVRVLARWGGRAGTARRTAAARTAAAARAAIRRAAGPVLLVVLGALVVLRVARVATSHPATGGETRLVESALAAVRGVPGPSVGPEEWLARWQLIGYAWVTGAFERHDSVVVAGREPAVLATAVLVACLLALVVVRGWAPSAGVLPLLAVLVMGPAVVILATIGPGILGAAWTAAGVLLLTVVRGRVAAVFGVLATAVGMATEPLAGVLLAAGIAMLATRGASPAGSPDLRRRRTGRHSRADQRRACASPDDPGRWLAVAAVFPVVGLGAVLAGAGDDVPLDRSERTVLLLLAALLTVTGMLVRRLRIPAAVAGTALVVAALPWPGAGNALPLALGAAVVLGALLVQALVGAPGTDRPHPLLRAAVAVPVLVLVVTGGLFVPSRATPPPHAALSSWLGGPGAGLERVAVPSGLWGELVRDGVPPDRLVRATGDRRAVADAAVVLGGVVAEGSVLARFGTGPGGLAVLAPSSGTVVSGR